MNAVKAIVVVAGLILVGMVAWWLVKLLFSLVLYLLVGVLVVGGGWYLFDRYGRSARTHRR